MVQSAPRTRSWRALENAHKPSGLHVIVTGEVQVPDLAKKPVLTESPARDPKVLNLELTLVDTGDHGGDVVVWMPAYFHKEVTADEYNTVTIRWSLDVIARVPVVDDREHQASVEKQMKALNAAAPKPKPKVAPKKAVKKASAKKKAPKAVGGWAKGAKKARKAAKKSPKKASKKASKKTAKKAKKAAKKSILKRLAGKVVKALTPAKKKKKR